MSDDSTRLMAPETLLNTAQPPGDRPPDGAIGPGVLVANTFHIERRLGGGGMGEVFLARHASLGTLHAVKMIRPSMAENRQIMDLFYREARVLRSVRHDAVVNYDGFVRDGEGREFLVMEYVEGTALSERLTGVPADPAEVLTLRERLCAGLAEAHRCGAVHRDLSPDNVILPGGRCAAAKLIDFGLAKLTDTAQQTIIGDAFAGKYRYAAPEQFGLYEGVVDARTDLYSLGLVLAAAARGRPLPMGENFPAAVASRQRVPDLSGIPPVLHGWLGAMLAPDPADRPASVAALLRDWPATTVIVPAEAAAAPPTAAVPSAPGAPPPAARRGPGRGLGLGLALLGLGAAGGGLYWMLRPLTPAPPPGPAAPGGTAQPAAAVATPTPSAAGPEAEPAPAPPVPATAPTPGPGVPVAERTAATAPAALPERAAATALPSPAITAVLRDLRCPSLEAAETGGVLIVTGQVRSGEKARLYDRLQALHPGRVDVTAVTTEPWPRCALAGPLAARTPAALAAQAPRILLPGGRTRFTLGAQLKIRIQSQAPRDGHIALAYVDSAGEAFHILPYTGEPDSIDARGSLGIAPLVAEPPPGTGLLVATWCPGLLYRQPPPEKEPVERFVAALTAALDGSADCTSSLLDLELRPRAN